MSPVVDSRLVPAWPLTLAETVVDWPVIDSHVIERRVKVEVAARPAARRMAVSVVEFGGVAPGATVDLWSRLELGLLATVTFGYRSVGQELRALRRRERVRARLELPDAGAYGRAAVRGLEGAHEMVRRRAREAAAAIAEAARRAAEAGLLADEDEAARLAAVLAATARSLHNHVIELVGEALNLGRTARVFEMSEPPLFAMRSEQLDKRTCEACSRLHGEILEVGSSAYFSYLPPAGCFGGGRCRGIMVYADGPAQVRGPATRPGPQPSLPAIPPVHVPQRRAA